MTCFWWTRKFVSDFGSKEEKCDVVINNAGIMNCRKMLTEDGIEMQLGRESSRYTNQSINPLPPSLFAVPPHCRYFMQLG